MDTTQATGTSLLEDPQAQALLADAQVTASQVQGCRQRLEQFLKRYLPWFYRKEQRENARIVIEGLLSGLERKTAEPIAREHGVRAARAADAWCRSGQRSNGLPVNRRAGGGRSRSRTGRRVPSGCRRS